MTGSRDWDAVTYDRISGPQAAWAAEQLERLELRGDEVVLDAGCGSGRVTRALVERVPRGRVYAVDVAPSMAAHAAEALGTTATVLCQDLTEIELPEPVDVVFSNATFHWIPDHDALFAALRRAMKPGARLLAQCGAKGNIDAFRQAADAVAQAEPFACYFRDWKGPWHYAGTRETASRLRAMGFDEVETWLEERPTVPEDPRAFVSTVCLVRHLERLPAPLRPVFVDQVLEQAGEPLVLGYIRLNMTARAAAWAETGRSSHTTEETEA